jgi:hypothetical protein
MIETVIAAGCSLTKDFIQQTWPDYLAASLSADLDNVGARGAGMKFVSRRTMMALEHHHCDYSLVVVMLPSSDRFDCYVDSNHVMRDDFVNISSWQDGLEPGLINLDGTVSQRNGYCLSGGQHRSLKKSYYKHYHNATAAWIDYWFDVINLQNYLRVRRFRYVFCMAYDLHQTVEQPVNFGNIEYDAMLNLVDFSRFVFYQHQRGFLSFAKDRGYAFDRHYPVSAAHQDFVESLLLPKLYHAGISQ